MKVFSGRILPLVSLAVAALLTGCTVTPQPMPAEEQLERVRAERARMFLDQEPVTSPLTLEELMARAIKYNLDHRVKLMEEVLAQRQLDVASYDLLPRLTADAGYVGRDRFAASSSMDVATGRESLVPSTSQDKQRRIADLGVTWNVLDFGVSYYQARQQADRTLIAKERQRKVVHNLMQQVRQAYWLALGAEQVEGKIQPLLHRVEQSLADSRVIEVERLQSPVESLSYQRQLYEALRQLEGIRDELSQAKPRLAALVNLRPGQPFQLAPPSTLTAPRMDESLEAMEERALLERPELVEARYNERIGVLETRKALARLLPGIELNLTRRHDSNSFLVDNNWTDAGLRVSWNLLNVLSAPSIRKSAEAQLELAKAQHLALSMAVLSQVHIAYHDYMGRKRQYEVAAQINDVDARIASHVRNAVNTDAQGRLVEIRGAMNALLSELRMYQSYGALQHSYGQMIATLGADPLPETVSGHDVETLAKALTDTARSRSE